MTGELPRSCGESEGELGRKAKALSTWESGVHMGSRGQSGRVYGLAKCRGHQRQGGRCIFGALEASTGWGHLLRRRRGFAPITRINRKRFQETCKRRQSATWEAFRMVFHSKDGFLCALPGASQAFSLENVDPLRSAGHPASGAGRRLHGTGLDLGKSRTRRKLRRRSLGRFRGRYRAKCLKMCMARLGLEHMVG